MASPRYLLRVFVRFRLHSAQFLVLPLTRSSYRAVQSPPSFTNFQSCKFPLRGFVHLQLQALSADQSCSNQIITMAPKRPEIKFSSVPLAQRVTSVSSCTRVSTRVSTYPLSSSIRFHEHPRRIRSYSSMSYTC
ncbi:uncharacterized protein FMAN_13812 [Fusarium mangiferae]|uniref:Uncharacterized protein n=1 Tax=Fusarium mangiferae TaxID=192010 RepID=A0A1L7TD72_FUSMA|nr:uncharacterized protein FMAN_13812 [Fusarium mangiferae]CVK95889.1 uncharacterized protein FMAN_13812 [Fusarium mangiferae]